jgi:hypothetical protein
MAVTSIELQLESENLVYFSGQRVKGALVLQIGLPVIIAGMHGKNGQSTS